MKRFSLSKLTCVLATLLALTLMTAQVASAASFVGRGGYQTVFPRSLGTGGFGFALVGTAPAGAGSSIAAIDEATNTI
jgi:hypothetical protein